VTNLPTKFDLPASLSEKVVSFGESSYGVTIVTLVLKDGTRLPHVHVAGGRNVIKASGAEEESRLLKLDPEEIADVQMSVTQTSARSNNRRSREIFAQAEKVLVGGVNSPVRAFRSVGGEPLIIERGQGQHLYDADGNQLLDFVCSWGAMLLGHAHPAVSAAITDQAQKGTSYGVTTELEVELAQRIRRAIPQIEKVRFVSSGTEATMSALRLARGYTGRDLLVKFEGCYHGHADSFLSQAGSGLATLGIAECPGVPQSLAQLTLNIPYNDLAATEKLFEAHANKIAAVIVEPIAANMGVVLPAPGFLPALGELTRKHGALLIVDEVITGFRLRNGSVQELFGVAADLTILGKIIGGGLPVAAYGGRAEIMDRVAPLGPVYQAGTLAGNPLAMRAGIATLDQLAAPGLYERIEKLAATLANAIRETLRSENIPGHVNSIGSLSTLFFTHDPVRNYSDAKRSDTKRYTQYFRNMLERGVLLAPSQFEASFVSVAHTEFDIDLAVKAAQDSLHQIAHC
jgi:glutamate-1-semialdehyde 2,1-aminomutase